MTKTTCLPRNRLKEYLNGWIPSELQSEIESHLQECPDCEKTIVELERDPDTLLEALHTPLPRSSSEFASSKESDDAVVAYAIARASQAQPESPTDGEPAVSHETIEASPKSIGPYTLLQPLGHGGMGTVYLAQHQELGKQVAIKLLPERAFRNDPYAARFQREIRTAGKLSHPSIVNATDAGKNQGIHFLVMEYIDGFDLSRIARYVGPLPFQEACKVAHAVALGLAYAHAEGIVHRDIKPSNLMLSRSGQVKILDFGLAQTELWEEASAELTTVGQLMGTLDYMAPEQAEKANGVDYRADLYSLGATLFRLLVGRAPLAATPNLSPLAKLRLLATSDPPSLGVLRPDLPKPLVELVDRLLQRDPSARPASAAHVAEALEPLSEGADLEELVRQAEALSQSKVELAKPNGTEEIPSWFAAQQTNAAGRGNRRRIGNWIALAFLPILAFAGILITIETNKGQLVIESDAANVEVKLLKDGKEYDTIQVIPGTQSTRLLAGKYEIIVDSASDQFSIDHDQVEVKRGQTLIARITSKLNPSQDGGPSALSTRSALVGDDLMYEGRTLDEWLRLLEKDRSLKSINESLRAIKALVTTQTAERVANRLLSILPELDGKLVLPGEPGEASMFLDYKVAQVIRQCYPDPVLWTKKLCAVVEASEDPFALRLLSNWNLFRSDDEQLILDPTTFLYWSLDKVFSASGRSQLVLPAAKILRTMCLYPGYSMKHSDQLVVIEKLQQSSAIPKSFYFEMIPDINSGSVWSPLWANAVQWQAIDALQDGKAIESEKLMAATMLRLLRQNKQGIRGLDEIKQASGIAGMNVFELLRLSKNPEDLLRTCVVPESYRSEVLPGNDSRIGREPIDLGLSYNIAVSGEEVQGNLALEYIRLWRFLPIEKEEHFRQAMQSVVDACLPNVVELMWNMEGNPYGISNSPNRAFSLGWPRLDTWAALGQSLPKSSATPAMWMSQFLFQEAMIELLEVDPSKQSIVDDLKKQWCERMVKRFDEDRNGSTSVEEADVGIRTHIWRGFGRSKEESISVVDSNSDGKVDAGELHECLTQLKKSLLGRVTAMQPRPSDFTQSMRNSPRSGFSSRTGSVPANPPASSEEASVSGGATPEGASDELLYEGKNLTTWLDLLQRERQREAIDKALVAIKMLRSKDDNPKIRAIYWNLYPAFVENFGVGDAPRSLSFKLFWSLKHFYDSNEEFTNDIVAKLDSFSANAEIVKALCEQIVAGSKNDWSYPSLVDWIEKEVANRESTSRESAAELARGWLIHGKCPAVVQERLSNALGNLSPSSNEFWFRYFPSDRRVSANLGEGTYPDYCSFPESLQSHTVRRLMDILLSTKVNDPDAVVAMILLTELQKTEFGVEKFLSEETKGKFKDWLRKELQDVSKREDLSEMVVLDRRMLHYALPSTQWFKRTTPFDRYRIDGPSFTPNPMAENGHALVIEKALLCIRAFGLEPAYQEELISIAKSLHPKVANFFLEVERVPLKRITGVSIGQLEWPTFKVVIASQNQSEKLRFSSEEVSAYWIWFTMVLASNDLADEVVLQQLLPDLDRRWCEALLRKLDQDGNGVTTVELQPFIESLLNRGMSSIELNIDSNADSQIDVEELYEWQKRVNEPKRTSPSTLGGVGSSPSPDGASRPGGSPANPPASSEEASTAGNAVSEGASDELLYEGKNLTTWLDLLQRERQTQALQKSIDAVASLSTEKDWPRIRQSIWATLPRWMEAGSQLDNEAARSQFRLSIGFQTFQILIRSSETRDVIEKEILERLIGNEFDSNQKKQLARLVQLSQPSNHKSSPLVTWLEATATAENLSAKEIAADIAREWLFQDKIDDQVRDKMAVVLESSNQIANDFWFRFFPVRARDIELLMNEGRVSSERVFPDVIAKVTTGRMFDILFDENTTEKDSIQAMIWLANLPDLGSHLEKWRMLDRRKVLHDKFKGLLANVIQSGDFEKLVSIDSRLIRFSYPKLWGRTNDPDFDLFVVDSMLVADRGDVAQSLLVEKCLLCIDSLGLADEFKEERIAILKMLAPNVAQFYLEVDHVPVSSVSRVPNPNLTWPPGESQSTSGGLGRNEPVIIQKSSMIAYLLWQSIAREFLAEAILKDELLPELHKHWCEALMKKLDPDGMGLTKEKFQSFVDTHRNRAVPSFSNLDSNNDGKIEVDELVDWPTGRPAEVKIHEATIRKVSEPLPDNADSKWVTWVIKKIAERDRNGDGYLDSAEWSPNDGDFNKVDSNSDGRVTLAEYYKFRRLRAAK